MTSTGVSLPHLLLTQLEKRPHAIAVDPVEGTPCTWEELHDVTRQWATGLHSVGVGQGDFVLTMLPQGLSSVLGWFAPSYLGAVEVPVNHAYRGEWLKRLAADTAAATAIIHCRFWEQWQPLLRESNLRTVIMVGCKEAAQDPPVDPGVIALESLLESVEKLLDPCMGEVYDIGTVMYTSGTTGFSKGVLMPWRQWQSYGESKIVPSRFVTPDDVLYAPVPPFHMSGKLGVYRAAYHGTAICTRDGFKTDEWLTDVRDHKCTSTWLIGAMARFVLQTPNDPHDADNPMRCVVMAPILPEVDDFKRRFGVEVVAGYSMTETNVPFCSGDSYEVDGSNFTSCGMAEQAANVRLVDESSNEVPQGEIGELIVRGEPWELSAGYLNLPEASLFARRDGWLHTGDAFRCDERGLYYFVDRMKDAIRRRGENISSFEVEAEINSHPEVRESAAFAVPSEWGEDEVMVAVVLHEPDTLEPAALIDYVRPRMPRFAIPRYVEFMTTLPKTPTEKVRKAELRARGVTSATWDASPDGSRRTRSPEGSG